jgi:serine/threonine-protein kinase
MLDYGVSDLGIPFIAMEHLEGCDLKHELRRRVLSPVEVASIVEQVSRALDRAHARGIIHRDVKPGNIFLCDVGGSGSSSTSASPRAASSRRR